MAKKTDDFSFEISLSVLNHLGRNLYRSFVTVLGEAISNSWDADAKNVWISIDKDKNSFTIKDDGTGMTANDFQNKFLKIGYSKRKGGKSLSPTGRPFIGRKGIGKLALLSCADKITIISKTKKEKYIGGVIDNSELDHAITKDLTPQQYPLGKFNSVLFKKQTKGHQQGTIIHFDGIKGGVKNSLSLLRKIIALNFRFSLLDKSFNIFLDGVKITYKDLNELAEKTEFLWNINNLNDPYIHLELKNLVKENKKLTADKRMSGFIASVGVPRDLNIFNIDERVSVDLFVNGRLREKNILKHIPSARIVEEYLYGQIHFNVLDDKKIDRFTSSREGIIADDPLFEEFLKKLKDEIMRVVLADWDKWRVKHKKDGDPDNIRISKKDRKSMELFNAVSEEYTPPKGSANKSKIDSWVNSLADDAQYNFSSYAECFISENLIRKYIEDKKIALSPEAVLEVGKWKRVETDNKNKGNISINIRRSSCDLSYLSMNDLAYLVDKRDPTKEACLARDANEYKPIRDALAHTALLTDMAKRRLTSVYDNIKGRIKTLLAKP
jgi:hypothetical protein